MAMSVRIILVILTICTSCPHAKGELEDWMASRHVHLGLSPHDWYAAPYKWQLLRAKASAIGDHLSQENRSTIWTHFRNIHAENFKFKEDDVKAAKLREFFKRVDSIKDVDIPIRKLINKEWFERKIVYDNQVIAIMEDDIVVKNSAYFLFNKHPEMSAVVKWNPDSQTFDILSGNIEELGPKSRIQIVGHGRSKNGKMFLSEMDGKKLAAALNTLPIKKEIGRISLVGCNLAAQSVKNDQEFLPNTFLEDFLKTLRADYHIKTTVSARSSLVQVDPSGRKYTAEVTPDGINWRNKDPKNKVVAELDNDNNVVYRKVSVTENKPVYPCRNCNSLGKKSIAKKRITEIGNLILVWCNASGHRKYYVRVVDKDLDKYLAENTKLTFKEVDLEVEAAVKNGDSIVNIRADVVKRNVYYYESGEIKQKQLDVREIRSYKQLVDEINWLGQTGVLKTGQASDPYEYYRFGDWVISFNLKNFYVGDHFVGRINDKTEDESLEDMRKDLKRVSEGITDVTYDGLKKSLSTKGKKYQISTAKEWINGENDNVIAREPCVEEACLTLAMFLSESSRNPKTHVINMMAISMTEQGKLTTKEFLDNHPMARGGSWPKQKLTGLNGLNDTTRERVLLYERHFLRLWLKGKVAEIRKSQIYCTEEDSAEARGLRQRNMTIFSKSGKTDTDFLGKFFPIPNSLKTHGDDELEAVEATGPLGESIQKQSNKIDALGKDLMMSMAIKQDLVYLERKMTETLQEKIGDKDLKNVKILEDSLEMKSDHLSFEVIKNGEDSPIDLSCVIEPKELKSNEILDKKSTGQSGKGLEESRKESQPRKGTAGAINALEEGDTVDGAVNLAQNIYGLSDMLEINKRVIRMAGKGLSKVPSKSLSKVPKAEAQDVTKLTGEGFANVIDIGFGIYNIEDDFKKHSTIGYIDGALDIAITLTDLMGPEMEPLSMALLIVRLGIDSFYDAFKKGLEALPSDATFSQTANAVFEAIGESCLDLVEQFNSFGQIYGAISETEKLSKTHSKNEDFVNSLSVASNYYKIQKENGSRALINLGDSKVSLKGGSIVFRLLDDGHAILTLKEVPDDGGNEREVRKNINLGSDVKDIVLGIGESVSLTWEEKEATVLWFITVYSARTISKETNLTSSSCGTYYGNSEDNKFFAVQKLSDGEQSMLDYSLSEHFYRLYGGDGDDTFFLGPQKSHVQGGEGRDSYVVPSYGGLVEIDNYAQDGINDYLFLDIAFSRMWVNRISKNLVLGHTTSHAITIKNWFTNTSYQHLVFKTNDGVLFEVANTIFNQPIVHAIGIDHSTASKNDEHVIDTSSLALWAHVHVLIGSNFSDTLIGNHLNNELNGRFGENILRGGPGADKYLIHERGWCDTVDNYATDGINDMLSLNISFDKIEVKEVANKSLKLFDNYTCVTISQWFVNDSFRHLTGMSSDGVLFNININKTSQVVLVPILMDYEAMKEPQTINLIAHVHFNTVTGVIGSPFNDVITGNSKNNYLAGERGNDTVEGGLGSDVYILHEGDGHDIIINKALDQKKDLLLFGCSYDNITVVKEAKDLVIYACSHPPASTTSGCESNGTMVSVRLQSWFKNALYQHLVVKSIDGVLFKLPTEENDTFFKMPIDIDRTKFKTNVVVNTTLAKWKTVQEIIGSNNANSTLTGNDLNNVLQVSGPTSYLEGCNGSDIYQIHSGNVSIQNFARDNKMDTLQLQDNFVNIAVQQQDNDLIIIRSMKNLSHSNQTVNSSVTVIAYKNTSEHQHLIGTTKDGIGFYFENGTFKPQAFMIDKHFVRGRLVINLGENYTWVNVTKVYGALKGSNHLIADMNSVSLKGGKYCDLLEGHNGNDVIKGDGGENLIDGQFGDDILVGGPGPDWILGSLGDDLLYPGDGADRIDGGLGSDTVIFQGDMYNQTGVLVDLFYGQGYGGDAMNDVYLGIDNIIGSQFNDILVGTDGNNILKGRGGDDFLYPHDGHDLLAGNDGTDVYLLHEIAGIKVIDNFAEDNYTDVLYMEDRKYESIRFTKNKNDLMVHVGDVYGWNWCPIDDFTIQITDWFKPGRNTQHLSMFLNDTQLSCETLEEITRFVPKSLHRPFWNKFICSEYRLGIEKIVAIMVIIIHATLICCISRMFGVHLV